MAKGPDFSHIVTRELAEEAAARGELEPLLLLPERFGGTPVRENVIYVPVGLAAGKEVIDRGVAEAVAAGRVRRYAADPEYQGKSFVPVRIRVRAWDPGELKGVLNVWGSALDD